MKIQLGFLFFLLMISAISVQAQVNPFEDKATKIILSADLDGDGVISYFEAREELLKDFDLIDTSKDKFIDQTELVFYLTNKEK